ACVARQMAVQEQLIETGMRREIGLWLRANAKSPKDSVLLEPLGYIGYFSQLKMLDFPGLASKEMVEARRRLGAEREKQAYLELKPDWVVVRPIELALGALVDPTRFQELYELRRVFDMSAKIAAIGWLRGRSYLQFDQTFYVFHRKEGDVSHHDQG